MGHQLGVRAADWIAELFTGLELVDPGLASCPEWHPHTPAHTSPDEATTLAAVARKP